MSFENITSVLGLLSIGGLLTSFFGSLISRREKDLQQKQSYKETRYKCIIMLAMAYVDFNDKRLKILNKYDYYLHSQEELAVLLRDEYFAIIFTKNVAITK